MEEVKNLEGIRIKIDAEMKMLENEELDELFLLHKYV